ncbi:TetR/AcrR family transcriptional regulator [Amycolatopsis sp. cmx-8-4]|uniref:TetR/AcrR family transcriptional regulator n=1 Tax=Amycolatopsis sp. cmx-8-4 TaxID=2790947 RepID=UPI00397C5D9C
MTSTPRAPGRPKDPAIDEELLRTTQDLLIEDGFERLTMDAVARRCGASKATIYRRWTSKTALVVAAAAALFTAPDVPDTGDLREDLLACGRAYITADGRNAKVLASVLAASRHDAELRDASQEALGAPYSSLFVQVLSRAVARGVLSPEVDIDLLAEVFPAIAYHRIAAEGLQVVEADIIRTVDSVLLPALHTFTR